MRFLVVALAALACLAQVATAAPSTESPKMSRSLLRRMRSASRRDIPASNLQMYMLMGSFPGNFTGVGSTTYGYAPEKTLDVSNLVDEAGEDGWPPYVAEFCSNECINNFADCASFVIDVAQKKCFLSTSRSGATRADPNAGMFVSTLDFFLLANNTAGVPGYQMIYGMSIIGNNDRVINLVSQFDKKATVLANQCASECTAWADCKSFDFSIARKSCYLSKTATAQQAVDPAAILFVKQ